MTFIEKIKEDADLSSGLEDRMGRLEGIHKDALDLLRFCNSRIQTAVEDSVDENNVLDLVASLAEFDLCFSEMDFSKVTSEIMAIDNHEQRRAIAMLAYCFEDALECLTSLEKQMITKKVEGKRVNAGGMRS